MHENDINAKESPMYMTTPILNRFINIKQDNMKETFTDYPASLKTTDIQTT